MPVFRNLSAVRPFSTLPGKESARLWVVLKFNVRDGGSLSPRAPLRRHLDRPVIAIYLFVEATLDGIFRDSLQYGIDIPA